MERWCMEMGFKHDDLSDFMNIFKKSTQPGTKLVWKHIIEHVRPRNEAAIIRKQCLLHKLNTTTHHLDFSPVIPPKSMNEYVKYVERSKDHYNLKKLQEEIEKSKASIKEQLKELKSSGDKQMLEEEAMKEEVYKLQMLKKKKISVKRQIESLNHDTNILNLITNQPNQVLGFGSDTTGWERNVISKVKELPVDSPCSTILSKVSQLHTSSSLPPLPYWDRTETLTLMENMLMSMIEKLRDVKSELKMKELEVDDMKKKTIDIVSQKISNPDESLSSIDLTKEFDNIEDEYLQNIKPIINDLLNSKPPYTLDVENQLVRRLQRQIKDKVSEMSVLLPVEIERVDYECLKDTPLLEVLPPNLPIDNLIDSIKNEVQLFISIKLRSGGEHEEEYNKIYPFCTSESQLIKLKQDLDKLSKLISFEEKLSSLNTEIDEPYRINSPVKSGEKDNDLREAVKLIETHIAKLNTNYNKVKKAFLFLRNEPLNEKLTGLVIEEKDISYWLERYSKSSERLKYEEWFQSQSTITDS